MAVHANFITSTYFDRWDGGKYLLQLYILHVNIPLLFFFTHKITTRTTHDTPKSLNLCKILRLESNTSPAYILTLDCFSSASISHRWACKSESILSSCDTSFLQLCLYLWILAFHLVFTLWIINVVVHLCYLLYNRLQIRRVLLRKVVCIWGL